MFGISLKTNEHYNLMRLRLPITELDNVVHRKELYLMLTARSTQQHVLGHAHCYTGVIGLQ